MYVCMYVRMSVWMYRIGITSAVWKSSRHFPLEFTAPSVEVVKCEFSGIDLSENSIPWLNLAKVVQKPAKMFF